MTIKLVTIDMDGTLLNTSHKIAPEVKKTIQKAVAKGVHIVLCTGRPIKGVTEQLAELELYNETDYVITYNGSLIQKTKSGEVISRHGLSYEDFLEIEVMARRVGSHLHSIDEHNIYTPNRDISPYSVHESFLVKMPLKYRTPEEITPDISMIKMMMIDEPAILDEVIKKIPDSFKEKYSTVKSSPFYYEIMNKEVSKGFAVEKLAQHLGYTKEEVMAIGDNENDLTMIEYAGIGVAMGNAIPVVKAAADVEVADNDHHGVAEAIKKYILDVEE